MKPSRLSLAFKPFMAAAAAALMLSSCSSLSYYSQAAQGQLELLTDSRPIDDWLADPATNAKLRHRLEAARQIRRYAIQELKLPDNGSYTNFTNIQRPYVLWNVVATPELSLKPMQWCFPVAGCVNYRGYYSKGEAQAYAKELRRQGHDVEVGGVSAYSTLGWFSDPLISTFINYPDAELARLIFHELAHQVVYVPGDSKFNESFASAVEAAGVEGWLERFGNPMMVDAFERYSVRKKDFMALLVRYRGELEKTYASGLGKEDKRATKARLFLALKDDYQVLKANWGGYAGYDRFFAEPLSNAHLASIATYNDFVPAFRALLRKERSWPAFYKSVNQLAKLDKSERHRVLRSLAAPAPTAPLVVQRTMGAGKIEDGFQKP
ncbi:Predicted aminopeptidase [Massilia yuzhufengensis]|uniref:Predicted aminopeptidase n=2 Tax=Massilia yuzhufengensis TaxID=1164594 RepID=A0A1I1T1V4_9BURK|nr:Predicted aminopeptidase [Massilia yuzhufengensis]